MNLREACVTGDKNQQLFYRYSNLPETILNSIAQMNKATIIIWNEEDEICYASKSISRIFGYEPEDVLGTYWYNYFEEEHVKNARDYLEESSNEPRVFYMSLLKDNSSTISAEFLLSKVYDKHTNSTYYICNTKRPPAENILDDSIIQAEKMSIVGQLTASVAHEIRNPLTSIKGFLQLLQAGIDHKDEYYRIMLDEVEKMESITSQLLDLSKPVSNEMKQESISEIIREVILLLQLQAKQKNISIIMEKPTDEKLHCNRSQIKQVLINLIKNAIEAMDEPGEIKLSVCSNSTHICIFVKDEGVGIPIEMATQLDKPFFTTKKNGTGLGLLITKQILKKHSGELKYLKNKEKGTTFYMKMPKVNN